MAFCLCQWNESDPLAEETTPFSVNSTFNWKCGTSLLNGHLYLYKKKNVYCPHKKCGLQLIIVDFGTSKSHLQSKFQTFTNNYSVFILNHFPAPLFCRVSYKCHQILQWSVHCHVAAILYSDEKSTLEGCQDNQPWFTEPQIGLHLGLEVLAMRLSRCCASQPITGELAEKDDIIGKLGQTQWVFRLSCPPVYLPKGTIALKHYWQRNSVSENIKGLKFKCYYHLFCWTL